MHHCKANNFLAGILFTIIGSTFPAIAASIPISYNLTGTGTVLGGTATTLDLDAQARGLLLSGDPGLNTAWNPVSYTDQSVLDFTTNLLNGNFVMTFDGDTLTGTVFENQTAPDTSPTGTGAFPQTLTFTDGTGEFAGATGSVSGTGYLGTTTFAVSGSGTLNTAPEPVSGAYLLVGLAILMVGRRKARKLVSLTLKSPLVRVFLDAPVFPIWMVSFALVLAAVPASADSFAYIESDAGVFGTLNLSTGAFHQIGLGRATRVRDWRR